MKKEELAKQLNDLNLTYPTKIPEDLVYQAKKSRLVIMYGQSDDLCEVRGAIEDELYCYDGEEFSFNGHGLVANKCEDENCPYHAKEVTQATPVRIVWCDEQGCDFLWTFKTDIPFATFDIFESNVDSAQGFCRGIVIDLDDIGGDKIHMQTITGSSNVIACGWYDGRGKDNEYI